MRWKMHEDWVVFLPLLQTDSPDGSTIHASRLRSFSAVITQKKKQLFRFTFIIPTLIFNNEKRKVTITSFSTCTSYTKSLLVAFHSTNAYFQFHVITFEIRHQCSHRSAIHGSCRIPPTSSLVQTTTGDAIWRVELKCLKDGQSFRAFYINYIIYQPISCFKLTHSFNFLSCTRRIS